MTIPEETVRQNGRERKRRNDGSHSQNKRNKKEEEKENLLKTPSSSPSSSSSLPGISRQSSDIVTQPLGSKKRKLRAPVKIDEMTFTFPTSTFEESLAMCRANRLGKPGHFLVRNVTQRIFMDLNRPYSSKTTGKRTLSSTIQTLEQNTSDCAKEEVLLQLTSRKINSWFNSLEATNNINATSMVDIYSIIIGNDNCPHVRSEGFSTVPLSLDKQNDVLSKAMFDTKSIMIKKQNIKTLKYVFIGIIATKMTAAGESEEGSRRRTRTAVPVADENVKYKKVVRFGSCLIYDKIRNIDNSNEGLKPIVLLSQEENPGLNMDHSSNETRKKWFSELSNLEFAERVNHSHDNSHIPRLIILTSKPDSLKKSDEKSEHELILDSPDSFDHCSQEGCVAEIPVQTKNMSVICPFRRISFETFGKMRFSMRARFPMFMIKPVTNKPDHVAITVYEVGDYFKETTVSKIGLNFYRCSHERFFKKPSIANSCIADIPAIFDEGEPQMAPRNIAPEPHEKKFGLNFIQSSSHQAVISSVYKNRRNSIVPSNISNDSDPRRDERIEHYPLNNAKMLSDHMMLHKDQPTLVALTNGSNEMQVVESPVSRDETEDFNRKLSAVSKEITKKSKKNKKSAVNTEASDQEQNEFEQHDEDGIDCEGRPIPRFAELFFPYGKNELYNVFLRFYYSEAGNRPGYFSADWKSRIMTGLVTKYYNYIFDNELDSLFKKQLQLIAQNSFDWKAEHHDMPMQKFREMKMEWKKKKNSNVKP